MNFALPAHSLLKLRPDERERMIPVFCPPKPPKPPPPPPLPTEITCIPPPPPPPKPPPPPPNPPPPPPKPPPPPPKPLNPPMVLMISLNEKPCLLILLVLKRTENLLFPLKLLKLRFPSNRSLLPAPANARVKYPLLRSFFNLMLMVLLLLPSSILVNLDCSLMSSKTCTLSTISAVRFFVASLGSFPKNSFPSTIIRCTCSPCAFTFPSLSTSIPGIFLSKSSTVAFGIVLNPLVLNWTVSFLTTMGDSVVITTPSIIL